MLNLVRAIACLAFTFVAGCKHQGSAKLEGHWRGQKAEGVAESVQLSTNVFAGSAEIFAHNDQIVVQTAAGRPPAATYTVDKEDATTLVIHTDRDRTTETFVFDPVTGSMTWKVDATRSIVFHKVE